MDTQFHLEAITAQRHAEAQARARARAARANQPRAERSAGPIRANRCLLVRRDSREPVNREPTADPGMPA